MGSKVEVPQPTAEENALRVEQTNLLKMQKDIMLTQQKQQTALLPLFAQQLGITLKFDRQGNVIGGVQDPKAKGIADMQQQVLQKSLMDILHPERNPTLARQQRLLDLQLKQMTESLTGPQAKQDAEIKRLLGERSLAALKGELPVDPALERDLKTQGETLRDRLQSQLGSGYETSSAGIEALQKFGEGSDVLRQQARTGQLTLAEQLSLAREGADLAQGGANLGAGGARFPGADPLSSGGFAFGLTQGGTQNQNTLRQVLAGPQGIAGGLGQIASGYQMPIGQLMQNRQMQLDANIQNSQNSMAGLGAFGSVFGTILGMSSRALKDVLGVVGETKEGIPIYSYVWKDNPDVGVQIGVMADDVKRLRPDAFGRLFGIDAVDYGKL